ncbi:MAG: NAD(P)-dependent oxidoreductase [Burkholderiales bacterium]|nr:NAD(P)-dependent oxidoreductase [Burkholderiales bacterium]
MRIAVLGATGVLGRRVLPALAGRGHEVVAVARDPRRVDARDGRIRAVPGDILDPAALAAPLAGCDAVLHLATAIPPPGGDWTMNDRVRREGTRNLLAAAAAAHVRRYVQQSVAMLLAGPRERVADEDAPLAPAPNLVSAVEMETLVRATPLDWVILRGGLFYGPGTGRWQAWNAAARERLAALPGDGGDSVSLVHVDDMATAVVLAAESRLARVVLNVVDDAPVTYAELFGHLARRHGAPPPAPGGPPGLASFRVSNARARQSLGWSPRYADYRSGSAAE